MRESAAHSTDLDRDTRSKSSICRHYPAGNAVDPRAPVIAAAGARSAMAIAIISDFVRDEVDETVEGVNAQSQNRGGRSY
jgi:hypothetical protein